VTVSLSWSFSFYFTTHTHTHDSEGELWQIAAYAICTLQEERESPSAQLFMCIYQRHGRQIINIHPRMFVCINH